MKEAHVSLLRSHRFPGEELKEQCSVFLPAELQGDKKLSQGWVYTACAGGVRAAGGTSAKQGNSWNAEASAQLKWLRGCI